jgi:hypothetical protein
MSKARDIASANPAPSTISSVELGYVDGVTSAIQTQLDARATLTGTQILTNKTLTSPVLTTPTISTITTKGDLLGYDTALNRIPIGTNNQVLTADSAQALGLKWATVTTGKVYSLISTTALTGAATITATGLGGYDDIVILVDTWECGTASSQLQVRFNADSGSNYRYAGFSTALGAAYDRQMISSYAGVQTYVEGGTLGTVTGAGLNGSASIRISGCNSASGFKAFTALSGTLNSSTSTMGRTNNSQGLWLNSAQLTSVSVISSAGNFTAGNLRIYASA